MKPDFLSSLHLKYAILILFAAILVGCSHSKRNGYSSPDLYEPVFLTEPVDNELQQYNTGMYLYENLDRNLTGQPQSESKSGIINSASLTATDEFLLSEGILPDSLSENSASDVIQSSTLVFASPPNPYIYEWQEWQNANQPYRTNTISYSIYTNYNPYDPYWFDPYWSYTRIRSYHYPYHPAYHYGGSLAFGYWYYPYHHHYYYYPYYPRKQRDTYTTEKPRDRRTGVPRNSSPHLMPASVPSYSSLLRSPDNRSVPNPSPDKIFYEPLRKEYNQNYRRNTFLSNDSPTTSQPRINIKTNTDSDYRVPSQSSNRTSFPSQRNIETSAPRTRESVTTSPRR